MKEMLREIERILEWPRMLKATVISKGFSFDEKYKIELESGASYFIKVCDSSYFERKQEEYEYAAARFFTYSYAKINSFY